MKTQWVGLLDCNNFFVSCERLFRPELKERPVLVLSSNDGCVVARSKEVKDMGIPMGVPYFQIKDIVKKESITTFSSHLALYRDISARVFSVMRNELQHIEQYSIDEAFFMVNAKEKPEDVALHLKNMIQQQVGIPVSVGLSASKTRAKYANTLAKKGQGVYLLSDKKWDELAPTIKLQEIWGLGARSELNYKSHGLRTVADFTALDRAITAKIFGVNGVRLQEELQGRQVFGVENTPKEQKSILSSRSFKSETTELSVLKDAVAYHVRHVAKDLRIINKETLNIRVFLGTSRHGDFLLRGGSKEAILIRSTSDTLELLRIASSLIDEVYEANVPYKKVGVSLSYLVPAHSGQVDLFDTKLRDVSQLMESVDVLNKKADCELVQIGSRLLQTGWQSKSETRSPAYTTRWADLRQVKAR